MEAMSKLPPALIAPRADMSAITALPGDTTPGWLPTCRAAQDLRV
jgi:hypothetical protein